jgi:hypothetical protein
VPSPWITPDEMIYSALGRSLYEHGTLAILGGPTPFYSLVYPAFVGLPLSVSMGAGYAVLKVLQALAMSLAAVPVFLWGRTLMPRAWALAAAALTLAAPALAYSGLIMTEVAFYPLVPLAAFALARALVEPTRRNQALLLGAILLCVLTRLQAIVLVPVLVTAILLDGAFARRFRGVVRFWPTFAALGVVAVAWAGWQLRHGGPAARLLGGYSAAGQTSYGLGDTLRYVVYHFADLLIQSCVFPVCALLLLLYDAAAGRERDDRVRAFLAVAASLAGWLCLEVGLFASRHVHRLAERDLIGVLPLLFLAFCLWLSRGGERRYLRTSLLSLAALASVLALPLPRVLSRAALPDAFTLIPLWRLLHGSTESTREAVVFGVAGLAVALFVLLPRRALPVLPVLVLAALAAASVSASGYVEREAKSQLARFVADRKTWIDDSASGPVGYVYAGEPEPNVVWENVFWNDRVTQVFALGRRDVGGPMPTIFVRPRADGRLVTRGGGLAEARSVVASTPLGFFGTPVAEVRQTGVQTPGLRLWRLDAPFRIATKASGIQQNGDVYAHDAARLTAWGCESGGLRLTLLVKEPESVTIRADGRVWKRLRFDTPGAIWRGFVPAGGHGECTFSVATSGLLGTTVFQYEP